MKIPKVEGKLIPPPRKSECWTFEITCPYCVKTHIHGAGDDPTKPLYGHRTAHCMSNPNPGYIIIAERRRRVRK